MDRTVIGYHGCDEAVARDLLLGGAFQESRNRYDWLGPGVYFWEHGERRAREWAERQRRRGRIKKPAVVGALIRLGRCFDLLDTRFTRDLEIGYARWADLAQRQGDALPTNEGRTPDDGLRYRDCAVLTWYLEALATGDPPAVYDTVRGCFLEGAPVFERSGIHRESHIQVAVRTPDCIVGVFVPRGDVEEGDRR